MTDSVPGHPASPDDPLASQRLELLGQLVVAQFDLEAVIGELARNGTESGPLHAQLQSLTQLQRQVGTATPAALAILRNGVSAAVAQSQSVAQEARTSAGAANIAEAIGSGALAATSRAQVTDLMRDMHRFDGELEFASTEEQAAYRQREAERRAFIAQEQGKGTPDGDLNAADGAVGQMADAHAHGANSPEFQQRWAELADSTQKLRAGIARDGGDVAKFDERLREDFRRILKSKGVPDREIDTRIAEHPDSPLEAVKACMSEGNDVAKLERAVSRANADRGDLPKAVVVRESEFAGMDEMAKFRAAGIVLSDHAADQPFAHGVSANEATGPGSGQSQPV